MKKMKSTRFNWVTGSLAIALALMSSPQNARANVYATDVQVNGSLASINTTAGSPISITYRLNQPATKGVTVNILNGNTTVASITGGTAMGLNTVSWTPSSSGSYSVSITAAATGFSTWTQISIDTNPGMPAFYPFGLAVDKNATSPYYGRVLVGCAIADTGKVNPFCPPFTRQDGIFKMNADGTYADEGGFGGAGYSVDDGGNSTVVTTGAMADSGGYDPWAIRIGEDDRCYWMDSSSIGRVVACDMQVTTNQVVFTMDDGSHLANPDYSDLGIGWQRFDITGTTAAHPALWIADTGDFPNAGVWMFHMVDGAVDPNDGTGSQVVQTIWDHNVSGINTDQHPADAIVASGGCAVDNSYDVFVSTDRNAAQLTTVISSTTNANVTIPVYQTMRFPSWNGGVLPPENSGESLTYGATNGQVTWGAQVASTTDYSWETTYDTAIDNHTHPTMVAMGMLKGANNGNGGGVKVINSTNGAVLITNLDYGNLYTAVDFDNVGNVYGVSSSTNCWRVWSPPGGSTNTTLAVAQVIIPGLAAITITGITSSPTTPGCATVTITFTASGNPAPSAFEVLSASKVNGAYTVLGGASITGGSGTYQATFSNCSTEFYQIEESGS